jgi:hypothetical protein
MGWMEVSGQFQTGGGYSLRLCSGQVCALFWILLASVIGATGAQGGGLVRAILNDPNAASQPAPGIFAPVRCSPDRTPLEQSAA